MEVPDNLKYTKDHEWFEIVGGNAVVGITEFAQSELGELVFVDLPQIGKKISKGDVICVVESTKAASDVYSPLSGVVSEINVKLSSHPELVNTAPYGDGWLVKLSEFAGEKEGDILSADQYKKIIKK